MRKVISETENKVFRQELSDTELAVTAEDSAACQEAVILRPHTSIPIVRSRVCGTFMKGHFQTARLLWKMAAGAVKMMPAMTAQSNIRICRTVPKPGDDGSKRPGKLFPLNSGSS